MKLKDIIKKLEEFAPRDLKEDWDNVGLMVGDADSEITKVALSLDLSKKALEYAIENKCELIVTHHPFIMPKLSNIDFGTEKGGMIKKLIENGISVYSMHTNLDTAQGGINDELLNVLNIPLSNIRTVDMIRKADLDVPVTFNEFMNLIEKSLPDAKIDYAGNLEKSVKTIGVCGGAGGSFLELCSDCDAFLTGELKYHEYQYAVENNICVVSAGHFETESLPFINIAKKLLSDLEIYVAPNKSFMNRKMP